MTPSIFTSPRHRALLAAMSGWMLDAMDFLLFTFAISPIQKEFGLSSGAMGGLTSVALIASAVGGMLFGRISDRIGRVRAMTISILLYSVGTAGLATAGAVWQLAAWRIVVGLGMGGEWSCGSVLVAEWWPAEKRGKAIGLMQSGWAIGAMIAAGLSALLLGRFSWRVLFLVGAFPALIAFLIRRTVPEPEIWRERRDESVPWATMFERRHRRRIIIATSLASSVLIAYWGLTSWLPAFLATPVAKGGAGLTVTKSAEWIIVLQAGAFLGYTTFGWVADRIGRRPAFTAFMIGAAAVVPLFAGNARSALTLLVFGPLVGYFGHGYFSAFGALLAELFPTSIRGSAQGFCYNGGRLLSALAPYAIGAAAQTHAFGAVLSFTAAFFLLGGILVWLLPETAGTELA